jgi:hypothetical protein
MTPDKKLDVLLAASCGCILDFKQIVVDYAAADPDMTPEALKVLAHKAEMAEGLATMLYRLIGSDELK